jgi:hypothetical protein
MTLSSGSALAASSSLNCFKKLPEGVDSPPVNFFRVQRYTYINGTTTTRLVLASDINNLAVQGFDASLYIAGKTWIDVATGLDFPIQPSTTPQPAQDTGVFVSLRFTVDEPGNLPSDFKVTGLAKSASELSGEGNVMTGSCWLSV